RHLHVVGPVRDQGQTGADPGGRREVQGLVSRLERIGERGQLQRQDATRAQADSGGETRGASPVQQVRSEQVSMLSKTGRAIWLSLSVVLIAWLFYLGTCDKGPLPWVNAFQARYVTEGQYSPAMSALVVFLPAMLLAWLPAVGWD